MRRAFFSLLALILVTPACSSLPVAGSDRDLTVAEGSTFQVVLSGQPGTGFSWTVDGAEAGTVELLPSGPLDRSVERSANLPGAGEQQTFVFVARRSGTVTLRFTYGRPWEKSPGPAHAYRVQVIRC